MDRVSTNLPNDNMQFYTRQRQVDMSELQDKMASQTRIQNLRDDPAAASHATRYQSYNARLERYSDNMQMAINTYNTTETNMRQAMDIMQEVRQLAVQGANGTYTKEELRHMATQVDEYLKQMVLLANSLNGDGTAVFAGERTKNLPFRVVEGTLPGSDKTVIAGVEYMGNIGVKETEISDNHYIETSFPGNQVFWAENQQVYAKRDASNFVVTADSTISVDGVGIDLRQGDNIYAIIGKINASKAAVKARLDPVQNSLVLETTSPHQLWLGDSAGRVLQDLGVVKDGNGPAPNNLAKDAVRFGGSLFDSLISLRDHLQQGDQLSVGGEVLRGVDSGMGNLLSSLGSLGAKSSRVQVAFKNNEKMIPDVKGRLSLEMDLDMTKAITDLKLMELTHEAALSTAAKVLRPTLLDFLR